MFDVRVPLRWSDLDAQGHVNNAVVTQYLQEARVALLSSAAARPLLTEGVVVVGTQVEYVAPISGDHPDVLVCLGVVGLGGSRFELSYKLSQAERTVARARTVLCAFDLTADRPRRLDEPTRAFLERYREPATALRPLEAPSLEGRGTRTPLSVRWSDVDGFGHVNNTVFFDYIQQARIEATTAWYPTMARAGSSGARYRWLVARQDVDHLAQLSHRVQPYQAVTALARLGGSSMTLVCELTDPDPGTVFASGRTILVCAAADGRPVALPDPLRAALEPMVLL